MSDFGKGICLIVGVISFMTGLGLDQRIGHHEMRTEAIKAYAAEWTIDPITGISKFKWKTNTDE